MPAKSDALHPLAELGAGVGGMTMPPAGLIWAPSASPSLLPGSQSVFSAKVRGVGETSLSTGVPTNEKYGNVYGWIVTLYPAARIALAT